MPKLRIGAHHEHQMARIVNTYSYLIVNTKWRLNVNTFAFSRH